MKADKLQAAVMQAAEIVKDVPADLREAAFRRVLDELIGAPSATGKAVDDKQPRPTLGPSRSQPETEEEDLFARLDRTKYAKELARHANALPRALLMLRAARDELHVDGLSSHQIFEALTGKFRVSVKEPALRMALDRAGALVDRRKVGSKIVYRIMDEGERFLHQANSGNGQTRPEPRRVKRARPAQRRGKSQALDQAPATPEKETSRPSSRPAARGVGPRAAIDQLITEGFFSEPRTVSEIREHLRVRRGVSLGTEVIAMALVRAVRDARLQRGRREDGNFEYSK